MSKPPSDSIQYLNGFNIRPLFTASNGVVMFTDGTNDVSPNQTQCEAYGYTYNKETGLCMAFNTTYNIDRNIANTNNTIRGSRNVVETGVNNTQIMGESNVVRSLSRNNLIAGSNNEISTGINNATILANNGHARTQGEFAIGGGIQSLSDSTSASTYSSKRKTSIIELSGITIDNTATNLKVQGGDSFIPVENNSIIGYDIYITRVEVGGSSGTAGNYSYRNIRGAVKINNGGAMSFVVGFSRNIAKVGVNGTTIMADSTTGGVASISVNVQDRNNVHNIWSASVTLHEVITTTALV